MQPVNAPRLFVHLGADRTPIFLIRIFRAKRLKQLAQSPQAGNRSPARMYANTVPTRVFRSCVQTHCVQARWAGGGLHIVPKQRA